MANSGRRRNLRSKTIRSRPKTSLAVELLESRDLPSGYGPFPSVPSAGTPPSSPQPSALPGGDLQTFHVRYTLNDGGAAPLSTSSPTGTFPAAIEQAYGTNQISFLGNPLLGHNETIAIVDAYDDPNIASDLQSFDAAFSLPNPPSFSKINENGNASPLPAPNAGWITEIALDVEWSHAIAPGASILLVEANSSSFADLFAAAATAADQPGVVVVSMSFGGGEIAGEQAYDSVFQTPANHGGVTFLASSGDSGAPPEYPAISPNVLAVGGTTLNLNGSGNIVSETGWSGSGGGISTVESQPNYQKNVVIHDGTSVISANGFRTDPDVAYDADPETGFPVYDTYNNPTTAPWGQWGGTSDASPQWAALIAIADQGRALEGLPSLDGPTQTIPALYALTSGDFHDITSGVSTGSPNYTAGSAYDLVTGRGSPLANQIVSGLIGNRFIVTAPANATAGSGFSVTLDALDSTNHTLTSYNGTIQFTSSDSQLAAPASAAMAGGVGTFSVTLKTAGNQTLTATDTLESTFLGISTISVAPAVASQFAIAAPPGAIEGTPLSFTVTAYDKYNNATSLYAGTVTFSSSDALAVLTANSTLASGVGTFAATLQTLGTQTLMANDSVTTSISGASQPISVSFAASHFLVSSPSAATGGNAFSFTLSALDASNNPATGYTGTVSFASSDSLAVLPANTTLSRGLGTFSATLKTAGNQMLTTADFIASSVTGTIGIAVRSAAASHFAVALPPGIITGTVAAFTVTAEDPFNNVASGFTGTVHFSSTDSSAVLPANSTLASGVGTFSATLSSVGNQSLFAVNASTTVSFSPQPVSPIPAGANSIAMQVADFNGDGQPDIAVLNDSYSGTVSVLLSNGNGTFRNSGNFGAGEGSFSFAAADLNHDNNLDLVVTDEDSGTVSVLLGNGNGTFGAATTYAAGSYPLGVAVGDFNGDGVPDLAVTNYIGSTVTILLGNGNGTFKLSGNYPTAAGPAGIAAVDVNHDQNLDLVIANFNNGYVSVLLGNGNGTFGPAKNYGVGTSPEYITVADFNGDGNPDVAVANVNSNNVSVLLGNANGTFHAAVNYKVGSEPRGITAADFNGDGKLDLVTSNYSSDTATVLLGNGNGTFHGQTLSSGIAFPWAVGAADLNGDGATDLALSEPYYNSVSVLLNDDVAGKASTTVATLPATHFVVNAPNGAVAGAATRFTVSALDSGNNTAVNYFGTVTFTSSDALAILPANSSLTNGVGIFSATLMTLGTQLLTATDAAAATLTGFSNSITVTDPATHFLFGGSSALTAGAGSPVTITALDVFNDTVVGYTGTLHFSTTDPHATLPSNTTLTNGTGLFSITLKTAANQTLTATDTVNGTLTVVDGPIAVSPAATSRFVLTAPASATTAVAFNISVMAEDPYNNITPGYTGTVSFSSSDTAGGAGLPGNSTIASGIGTFSATLQTAGLQTVTAADSITGSLNGSTSIIIYARPTHFVVSAPVNTSAGSSFLFDVTAVSAANMVAPGYTGTVTFSSSDPSAVLPPNATLTNGIGSFFATLSTAGNQTLTATDTPAATLSGFSNAITVLAGAATHFTLGTPSNATAGSPFALTVTALDAYNNTAVHYGGVVQFGTSDAHSPQDLPGGYTFTSGDAGQHVFVNGASLYTVGPQTITGSDTNNGSISGLATISVSPGGATTFAVSAASSVTAGGSFTVAITAKDNYNNTVPGYSGTVSLSTIGDTNAQFSPASTLSSGAGTFSAILFVAGSRSLTASDTAGHSGLGNVVNVSPATASHLVFYVPGSSNAGSGFSFALTAEDPYNNTASGYNGSVSFTSSDQSVSTSLPGISTLAGGVGTFNATLTAQGHQTLTAADITNASLTGVSAAILVNAPVATHFIVSGPAAATAGGGFVFTVTAEDPFNNTTGGYTGTVTFTSSDTGASTLLPGSTTLTSGMGTFSATLTTAANQILTASDEATHSISGRSNTIIVSTTATSHLVVSASSSTTAGVGIHVTVVAEDRFNNTAVGYGGTVAFSSTDGGLSTSPASSSLTSGIGTFTATLTTAGSQTLTANDKTTSSISGASKAIVVSATTATHFAVSVPLAATAGSGFFFTVLAQDPFNNLANSYTGTVKFFSTDAATTAALPAGTPLTSGVGTFNATLTTAGKQTLTAIDSHTGSILGTSNSITIRGGSATHFSVSAASTSMAGSGAPFTVTAFDIYNNTASGYGGTVTFTSSDTGTSTRLPQGIALLSGLGTFSATLTTVGNQIVAVADATNSIIAGMSSAINVSPAAASHFVVSSPGTALAGIGFGFTVKALDPYNNAATTYAGTVSLSSSDSGAILPLGSTLAVGVGSFNATLATRGSQTLIANDLHTASITGISATITVNRPPATHFSVNGSASTSTAGVAIGVTVIALDQFNHTALGYAGTAGFSSSDTAASLPPPSTLSSGVGIFSATLVTAGSQTITVTDPDPVTGSFTVNIIPAAATSFVVSAPAFAEQGTGFGFTVTARDPFGNTAVGYNGTVTFSTSDTAIGVFGPGRGTLTSGVGSFSATLYTLGNQIVTATDTLSPSINGSGIVDVPVTVSVPNAIAGRNSNIAVPINVNGLYDPASPLSQAGLSGGNFVLYYDPNAFSVSGVNLGTISSPAPGDSTGTLPGDGYSPANTNGWAARVIASSPGYLAVSVSLTGSGQGLALVTNTGGGTLVTVDFHVLPGASLGASTIDLGQDSGGAPPITYISDAVDSAQAEQPYGIYPAPDPADSFTGTDPVNGIITITGVNLPPVANNDTYSITERDLSSDPGLTVAASTGVLANDTDPQSLPLTASLISGPAHGSLTFNGDGSFVYKPNTGYLGSDSFRYQADDGYHITAATVNLTVTARLSIPTTLDAPVGGTVVVPVNIDDPDPAGSNGLIGASLALEYNPAVLTYSTFQLGAGFSSWSQEATANNTSGLLGISILAPGGNPDTSTAAGNLVLITFQVNGNAPTGPSPIYLVQQVSPISTPVPTALTDANLDTIPPRPQLTEPPAPATNTPTSFVNGVDGTVTILGANHFVILAPATAAAGKALSFTVTAQDQFFNLIPGYSGTVHFLSTDPGAILPADSTLTSGVGTFSATLASVGTQTLMAVDATMGGITGVSGDIAVSAAVDHFVIAAPASATAGNPLPLIVVAEDPNNNIATGYTGTVHFGSNDSQAILPANATLSGGVGYFATTLKTAATQYLFAVDTGNASIVGVSNSVVVSAAAASRFGLTFTTPSYAGIAGAYPNTATAASTFASTGNPITFTVTALDPFGNLAPSYAGTVTFSSSDTAVGVSLPANHTLTSGVGTFSATLQTPGMQFITATDTTSATVSGNTTGIVTRGLVVTSFAVTPTGFTITFNKPFKLSVVNLYTTAALPDDVTLTTTGAAASVRGSLVFNSTDTGFTFVKTATTTALGAFSPTTGLLATGKYTLTLRSFNGSGFEDSLGGLLDGTDTAHPGTTYQITFSVAPPPVAVGIPDFARGPSNTDALFISPSVTNGSTFPLSYTNPNTSSTGTATVTFNTIAAILQNNIQLALNGMTQVGSTTGTPNTVVVVTNDTTTGTNVLVTFQNTLATVTSQLLTTTTAGITIGQATVNVPNNVPGVGVPIALSSGLNVTSGTFVLQYNPALLSITGVVSKLTAVGATFSIVSNLTAGTSGTLTLSLSSPAAITATTTAITLGSLVATVPLSATASYGAKQLLHFSSEQLNGGAISVTNVDGLQVVAYLGDVTDKGGPLSLSDAGSIATVSSEVTNTTAQTIPGFPAFPTLDPVIIGDVSLQGSVNSTDAGTMNQEVGGTSRVTIPYAPIGLSVAQVGPDLAFGVPAAGSQSSNTTLAKQDVIKLIELPPHVRVADYQPPAVSTPSLANANSQNGTLPDRPKPDFWVELDQNSGQSPPEILRSDELAELDARDKALDGLDPDSTFPAR